MACARGDVQARAESSARRILDEFLCTLREEDVSRVYLEDVWPNAQIKMDPEITARLHDHAAPAPDYLRILLGRAVRQLRKERGLSQQQLAATIALPAKHIAALERLHGRLDVRHLGQIAVGLGVPVSEVFRRAEQTEPQLNVPE